MADDFITKVRGENPFPWRQLVRPNGVVQIIDANNVEVPLFTIVQFVTLITNVMSGQKEKTCEAP